MVDKVGDKGDKCRERLVEVGDMGNFGLRKG